MSEQKINFSDYKASGVYFIEIDNSIIQASSTFTARLAVGFCDKGPFNRPIYISSTADCDELLGGINRKLERKGCFTNRNVRTMVLRSPLYLLNLLPVDTQVSTAEHKNLDVVGLNALSFDMGAKNKAYTGLFADMFERSKFWVADEKAMMNAVAAQDGASDEYHSPLYGVGNCGTKDISLIVRKAENLAGYHVTFREWYGGEDQIPYKWINPDDYVEDYFVQVIAVKGLWDASQYATYAADPVWRSYFTKDGLKAEKLNKFLHLDAVTVLGNWTGCIVPNFYDKQNKNKSIDFAINKVANSTGLLFGFNATALDALAFGPSEATGEVGYYLDVNGDNDWTTGEDTDKIVDLVGHSLTDEDFNGNIEFLSYKIKNAGAKMSFKVEAFRKSDALTSFYVKKDDLDTAISQDNAQEILVGDYVKTETGYLGKIIKKRSGIIDSSTEDVVSYTTTVGNDTFDVVKEVNPTTGVESYSYIDPTTGNTVAVGSADVTEHHETITHDTLGYIFTVSGIVKIGAASEQNYQVENAPEVPDTGGETPDNYQDYMVIGDEETTEETDENGVTTVYGKVTVVKNIISVYDTLSFIPLKGLKIRNRHMPGYDAEGNLDIEGGIEKIYKMLEDPAIKKGLLNNRQMDFRYVVDTMGGGHGEECGGKKYLSRLALAKQHCTALISIPSVSDFAKSAAPVYCDTFVQGKESKKAFNAKYIATGGNQDMSYAMEYSGFSTITEENGAKNCGLFTPYLIYQDGTNKILVPPAADVSNTYMSKFLGGDPYCAVANMTGYINNSNVLGLEYVYDIEDCGYLEPEGINPIVLKNGSSYTIYGDRTSYQRVKSDFNYLHVRELLNTIELKCYDVLQDYVFKYNIPQTRAEIYTRLVPILQAIKDGGALVKFDIQIDENNNTKEVIDNDFCIIDIGLWVSQCMEKIVTRLTVNRSTDA